MTWGLAWCKQSVHAAVAVSLLLLSTASQSELAVGEEQKRPNILFILADDLSHSTVGINGTDQPQTPSLNRLASEGTVFTHAYNQGGWHGAICVASRSMLNTGCFLWHAQRRARELDRERNAGRLWSQYLRGAGYQTYFSGKWHLQTDASAIFDVARHVRPGMPQDTPQSYHRPRENDSWKPWDRAQGGYWEGGRHWSEVLADDACDYLAEAAEQDKPFFMYLAFNAPHDPRQAPREFIDLYPLSEVSLPVAFLTEYPDKDAIGCGPDLRDEKLAPFPRTPRAIKVHRQEYYGIISHMDKQIGRILDALNQSKLTDNTYVIFSSDHGLAVGSHGLLGKQNMYDHSVRIPFCIKGPSIAAGKRDSAPIYLQDVMPTTLELAGVPIPKHVDFRSLLPLLSHQRNEHYKAIYGAYMERQRMVTEDGYKLILYPRIKKVLLFNLRADPHELQNLAAHPEQRERVKKLFSRLLELQQETGDSLDLEQFYPGLS